MSQRGENDRYLCREALVAPAPRCQGRTTERVDRVDGRRGTLPGDVGRTSGGDGYRSPGESRSARPVISRIRRTGRLVLTVIWRSASRAA